MYYHLKKTVLKGTYNEWIHLQVHHYKNLIEYNYVVFRMISELKLCRETIKDEDMFEKKLTTFHVSTMILH